MNTYVVSGGQHGIVGGRPSPVVLRLLPRVPHPPARIGLAGAGAEAEAEALRARGYAVVRGADAWETWLAEGFPGPVDAVCEVGMADAIPAARLPEWAVRVSRALPPGGRLFGGFSLSAGELGALLREFDFESAEPSAFGGAAHGRPLLEVVCVRR